MNKEIPFYDMTLETSADNLIDKLDAMHDEMFEITEQLTIMTMQQGACAQ